MQNGIEEREQAGGEEHGRRVENIVGGDQAPLVVAAAPLLQKGVERHREKSGGKPHRNQRCPSPVEGITREKEKQRKNSHSDGAERHEPELDLVAREPSGGQAADANADGHECPEQADAGFADVQYVLSEEWQNHLQERAQKPEV